MNYLFKAFKMNSLRELQYARNKYREVVNDIEVIGDKLEAQFSDYKIAKDLWTEFQFNYIIKEVEMSWDKNSFYLFKLKYVLNVDDETIKRKQK